jgi:hypothetical protein
LSPLVLLLLVLLLVVVVLLLLLLVVVVQIVPADLNAWLYQMEQNIAWAADILGDAAQSSTFQQAAAKRAAAIEALLWDDAEGTAVGASEMFFQISLHLCV